MYTVCHKHIADVSNCKKCLLACVFVLAIYSLAERIINSSVYTLLLTDLVEFVNVSNYDVEGDLV